MQHTQAKFNANLWVIDVITSILVNESVVFRLVARPSLLTSLWLVWVLPLTEGSHEPRVLHRLRDGDADVA